jgi:hypothetical protein
MKVQMGVDGVGGQRYATAALSPEKIPHTQGRSGRVRKIISQPGFDPRTVQTVASSYTD